LTVGSPTISAISVTDASTVSVTGTGFPTSGYTCSIIFKGVESSSATISSATAITATFSKGVPLSSAAADPIIRFTPSSRRMLGAGANFLEAAIGAVKLTNAVSVTASTTGLQCSYQGGCSYEVTANGLTATLKQNPADEIDVCGETCVLDEVKSTAAKAVCTLPRLATTYSATNYKVVTSGSLLKGTWTGTATAAELLKLTDGKNVYDMTDATATNCHF